MFSSLFFSIRTDKRLRELGFFFVCSQTKEGGLACVVVAVLAAQKTRESALLIYSSYEDAKASPKIGDFIVLSPKNEGGTKYLARVEAEVYDEDPLFRSQDKTLVAVHYARIA